MFASLRAKQPAASLAPLLFHSLTRRSARIAGRLFFGLTIHNVERVPASGPLLIAANHQSYLDPPLMGGAVHTRHLDYIARGGLFKFKPLGLLIAALSGIPIKEESGDLGAIKEVVKRLDMGRAVLIFPEGSRTFDGELQEFKRGVALLVKKAKCPVVPAAITGAYENWPRSCKFPRPWRKRITIRFGEPVSPEELAAAGGSDAGLALLRARIEALLVVDDQSRARGSSRPGRVQK